MMIDETIFKLKNLTSSDISSFEKIFEDFGLMKLENFLMFCNLGLILIMMVLLCVMMRLISLSSHILAHYRHLPFQTQKGILLWGLLGTHLLFESNLLGRVSRILMI